MTIYCNLRCTPSR